MKKVYSPVLQYHSGNHKLPMEIDRWKNIAYNQRMCPKCSKHSLGDEFHYLLECEIYKLAREQHIKRYYYRHPNELMNNSNTTIVKNLSIFLGKIINDFDEDYKMQFSNRWQI